MLQLIVNLAIIATSTFGNYDRAALYRYIPDERKVPHTETCPVNPHGQKCTIFEDGSWGVGEFPYTITGCLPNNLCE
jgi:hypothetical protein